MIQLSGVAKRHGSQILYVDADLTIQKGDRIGLVGANGAGKSTIFRLIVGQDTPDAGQIIVEKGTSIGYFDQNVGELSGMSTLEATIAGAGQVAELRGELSELEAAIEDPARIDEMNALVEKLCAVQEQFGILGGYELESRAQTIIAGLGFSQAMIDGDVGLLSGGWKMRVALARVLLMQPNILLLDEPTNHLDIESIVWLESFLKNFEGGLILTSHDRTFMNRLVTSIVDIDAGELTNYVGDYESYQEQWQQRRKEKEAQFARQKAMLAKEQAFIDRFKARASHAAQVQSRVKKLDKIEKVEPPKTRSLVQFKFPSPPRSGDDVAQLKGVSKSYGEKVIYSDYDFLIRRRERWCVMGINGVGKSTLLKLITGHTEADQGEIKTGANLKLGYFAQHSMDLLDGELSVLEMTQREFPKANLGIVRNLLGAFGFSGDTVEKKCSVLSGGEKARMVMALMLFDPPNFLVLDEPTNHLDIDTKEMLTRTLADYEGTILFVSHDRRFLSEVATHVLEVTPKGPRVYNGSYDEYVASIGAESPGLSQN